MLIQIVAEKKIIWSNVKFDHYKQCYILKRKIYDMNYKILVK